MPGSACNLPLVLEGHNRLARLRQALPDLEEAGRRHRLHLGHAKDDHEALRWTKFWARGVALDLELEANPREVRARLEGLGLKTRAQQVVFLRCLADAHVALAFCPMEDILPRAQAEKDLAALLLLRLDAENFFPSVKTEAMAEPFQTAYLNAFAALAYALGRNDDLFRREFEKFVREQSRPILGEALAAFLKGYLP